jgi:hypothetical protein
MAGHRLNGHNMLAKHERIPRSPPKSVNDRKRYDLASVVARCVMVLDCGSQAHLKGPGSSVKPAGFELLFQAPETRRPRDEALHCSRLGLRLVKRVAFGCVVNWCADTTALAKLGEVICQHAELPMTPGYNCRHAAFLSPHTAVIASKRLPCYSLRSLKSTPAL